MPETTLFYKNQTALEKLVNPVPAFAVFEQLLREASPDQAFDNFTAEANLSFFVNSKNMAQAITVQHANNEPYAPASDIHGVLGMGMGEYGLWPKKSFMRTIQQVLGPVNVIAQFTDSGSLWVTTDDIKGATIPTYYTHSGFHFYIYINNKPFTVAIAPNRLRTEIVSESLSEYLLSQRLSESAPGSPVQVSGQTEDRKTLKFNATFAAKSSISTEAVKRCPDIILGADFIKNKTLLLDFKIALLGIVSSDYTTFKEQSSDQQLKEWLACFSIIAAFTLAGWYRVQRGKELSEV